MVGHVRQPKSLPQLCRAWRLLSHGCQAVLLDEGLVVALLPQQLIHLHSHMFGSD